MHSFLHYVNSKELGSKETNQTRDNMIIYAYLIYTYIYFYLSGGLYEVFFKSDTLTLYSLKKKKKKRCWGIINGPTFSVAASQMWLRLEPTGLHCKRPFTS